MYNIYAELKAKDLKKKIYKGFVLCLKILTYYQEFLTFLLLLKHLAFKICDLSAYISLWDLVTR